MEARLEASDCREVTVVVSAVMRDEFWSRMRFCRANRAWMLGSNGGGGSGWCRDEVVGWGGGVPPRCDIARISAFRLARVSIAAASFVAIRDF